MYRPSRRTVTISAAAVAMIAAVIALAKATKLSVHFQDTKLGIKVSVNPRDTLESVMKANDFKLGDVAQSTDSDSITPT